MINPSTFDMEAWLTAQRIGATGTVKIGEFISSPSNNFRDNLRHKLHDIKPNGGVLAALITGDSSALNDKQWQLLQATGTVHLMVISGTHIGMLCMFVYFLVKGLFKLGLGGNRSWITISCITAGCCAILYGFIAGFGVPVQRALVMLLSGFIWRYRYSYLSPMFALLVALNLVLIIEPLASLQIGFWLSFGAVLSLVIIFSNRIYVLNKLRSLTYAQFAITIGLLPILVIFSLPIGLSAPIANFIAVPWVGCISIPLALLGSVFSWIPYIGDFLLQITGYSLEILFWLLEKVANYISVWHAPKLPWYVIGLSVLGALIMISSTHVRALGLILFAGIFISPSNQITQGYARIWLLDVGQGLSVVVQTQNHTLLYDTAANINGFDRGQRFGNASFAQF